MNFISNKIIIVLSSFLIISFNVMAGSDPRCPVMIPQIDAHVSVTSNSTQSGSFNYIYRFGNGSDSVDYINTFELVGINQYDDIESPPNWDTLISPSVILWYPTVQLTDGKPYLSSTYPSSVDVPPGGTSSSFSVTSPRPKGLVLYQMGARRDISTEMASLLPDIISSNDSSADPNASSESFAEQYIGFCGVGNIGQNSKNTVYGVTEGPTLIPTVAIIGNGGKIGLPLTAIGALTGSRTLKDVTGAVIVNQEIGRKLDLLVEKFTTTGAGGVPSLSFTIPPSVAQQFTCRTKSALIDFMGGTSVLFRAKVDGSDLGLPAMCTR